MSDFHCRVLGNRTWKGVQATNATRAVKRFMDDMPAKSTGWPPNAFYIEVKEGRYVYLFTVLRELRVSFMRMTATKAPKRKAKR